MIVINIMCYVESQIFFPYLAIVPACYSAVSLIWEWDLWVLKVVACHHLWCRGGLPSHKIYSSMFTILPKKDIFP